METTTTSVLEKRYNDFKKQKLNLNLMRGLPSLEQLDLSLKMSGIMEFRSAKGIDCRTYGYPEGLPEIREFFAEYLGVAYDEILVVGNSSITLMHDVIVQALLRGFLESEVPWCEQKIKFLCPVPGYDRHFDICEAYGFEMLSVPNKRDKIDIEKIEEFVEKDSSVKGLWYVPKYQNPEGFTCTNDIAYRLSMMKTKASDFRIFWDNAYALHDWIGKEKTPRILEYCKNADNPNRVFLFGSTSKITFASGGVAMIGASRENLEWFRQSLIVQKPLGSDKLNQLRHLLMFPTMNDLKDHMRKHAEIVWPKFIAVNTILKECFSGSKIAAWSSPHGGYFVSLNIKNGGGSAKRAVELAEDVGVHVTPAGATFPYSCDPNDSNIRIAPTYPPLEDLKKAMEVLVACVQLSATKK
jgi:DNA-binding transcriptional MocR family regulator